MFKSDAQRLKFKPGDGMAARPPSGAFAFIRSGGGISFMFRRFRRSGRVAMELAFQQLRAKLEAEGLFAAERKKPLPRFPVNVLLVTSRQTPGVSGHAQGAAAVWILKIKVFHVAVQGEGAAGGIAEAIKS